MKLKDFFTKIGEHIPSDEFKKFIDTVPDSEIDDALMAEFENTYLTRDRAAADKDVIKKIWPKALDPIDREIKVILQAIGHENTSEIEKEGDTYKKIALITKEIPLALQRASKGVEGNEEFKKKLAQKDNELSEMAKKFETVNSEWEVKLTGAKAEYENRLHDFRLDNELEKLSGTYTFAEAYEKTRGQLQNALLGDLKKSHKFQLAEKEGKADVLVLDENGSPRYNGNTPVTIKSLLDEAYKPFLKQSNADGNGQQQQSQATQQRFQVQTPGASVMPRRNTG